MLTAFLRDLAEPERGGVWYFYEGKQRKIQRRAQLSRMLSNICATIYDRTPVINNETLNRNTLTPASQRTRERVIEALLAPDLAPDLGQKGVSQGMAFVRSALRHTGILVREGEQETLRLTGRADERIEHVMQMICGFFAQADGGEKSSFGYLYDALCAPAGRIAMKRGPIPILLAAALHGRREHMTILVADGREMELRADLFRAIEAHPERYRVQREQWSAEKDAYIRGHETLFIEELAPHERQDPT